MSETEQANQPKLIVGERCLLSVMGRHFMVRIMEVTDAELHLSFPGVGYPVEGTPCNLEVHDDSGFFGFSSVVVKAPGAAGDPVVLQRPVSQRRHHHRRYFRVPTDLTVQVRDQVHVRRYDAALLDFGLGGCLLQCEEGFEFGTTLEVVVTLPETPPHTVLGQIVHFAESTDRKTRGGHLYGVRFVGMEPLVQKVFGQYIWQRLRELYPTR